MGIHEHHPHLFLTQLLLLSWSYNDRTLQDMYCSAYYLVGRLVFT